MMGINGKGSEAVEPNRAAPSIASTSGWSRIAVYILLFILCAVTYHGMNDNYLFNDDFSWISEARYTMEWGNVLSMRVIGFFRPLVNVSFFLTERIAPENITFQYGINLLLHVLCCILVYHLIGSLGCGRAAAIIGAALFAVTSVHAGAVLWISARTTLLSSTLLLSSILLLMRKDTLSLPTLAAATLLYALALSAKETAIAGLPLILLLWRLYGDRPGLGKGLAASAAVSLSYLILRRLVMGGFVQDNWGPGLHMIRNIAGGFLYQAYPWPVFSLFYPRLSFIQESAHPFVPEIIVIPIMLLLFWAGRRTDGLRRFGAAAGWALIALLPSSLFTYRFFSTASITQSRYYYLSSVGTSMLIALFIGILWESRSVIRRSAAVTLCLLLATGYMLRVHRLEIKMDEFTFMYREITVALTEAADEFPRISTLAVEDPPMAFRYLEEAVRLERPRLKLVAVSGGRDEALAHSPCLYVTYSGEFPKVMRMEKLE
jgi:hypothetical protein